MENQIFNPYIVDSPVVDPACFYGRSREVEKFFDIINGDKPFAPQQVVGMNKSGMTSFLLYISNKAVIEKSLNLDTPRTTIAYIDLKKTTKTPRDFFNATAKEITKALPEDVPTVPHKSNLDFSQFNDWLDKLLPHTRIVVLLDDFEVLIRSDRFGLEFFSKLRSLANNKFTWVTASKAELYRLFKKRRFESGPSPFWNIFLHPVYLGAIEKNEIIRLIRETFEKLKFPSSGEQEKSIIRLAGRLPYFIQVVTKTWIDKCKTLQSSSFPDKEITDDLRASNQFIASQFVSIWENLSDDDKERLLTAAKGVSNEDINDTDERLIDFGLLQKKGDAVEISGEIFKYWLLKQPDNNLQPVAKDAVYDNKTSDLPSVFICYCRQDIRFKNSLIKSLKVGAQYSKFHIWQDGNIPYGEPWKNEIEKAIEEAKVAILLISDDFLGSKFIIKDEIPRLWKRKQENDIKIIPIIVSPCSWQLVPWLEEIEVLLKGERTLASMRPYQRNSVYVEVTRIVSNYIRED